MEEITTVIKGTELKVLFTASIKDEADSPSEGKDIAYSDTLYKILYYTTDKSKALVCSSKAEENTLNHVINEDGILVRIPTENLDAGALKCEATLYIQDDAFDNDPTQKDDSYENELEPDYYKLMVHALNVTTPSSTLSGIYVKEWIKDIKVGDILICYNSSGDRYSTTLSGKIYLVKLEVAEITENKALVKILDNNNNYIFGPDVVVEANWVATSYIKEPTSYDGYRKEIQRETTKIKIIE